MKTVNITVAALVLSAMSFGAFAAQTTQTTPSNTNVAATTANVQHASDIEAGSNIAPGSQSTGQSMDDAFNVYTLVAGGWS
ncbi:MULTISPECIES: hypothetical protein [Mangrovibacter]|uniref:Uncharacterized protein n=1 Tax=Mangrovibacter plantisponsor TaxID=451513 RepID=A0A317PVR2_9ENTR|nr:MULTISPECIES: hypothetical protein [Mangrovibacter]KEA52826.1 hypothetical protein DT73_12100 [Mangrovibacter sp. MFB070]PWW05822.1 hypothetical protein DES37_11286 [Mangrovibacter plantisponsor]